jgi:RND family efflux transporter MFP subunit
MQANHTMNGATPAVRPAQAIRDEVRSLQLSDAERRAPAAGGRRRLPAWVWGLALLVGTGYGLDRWRPRGEAGEEIDVFVFSARTTAETLLEVNGNVVPRERINISAEAGGVVVRVAAEEGMRVKKGALLVQIDDARYRADLESARAALALVEAQRDEMKAGSRPQEIEQARASWKQAAARRAFLLEEWQSARVAEPGKGITRVEADRIRRDLQAAEAALEAARQSLLLVELGPREERKRAAQAEVDRAAAALAKAQVNFDRTRIVAPCDAVVLEKKVEVGEVIRPETATSPLVVLANPAEMEVEVEVSERNLQLLKQAREGKVLPEAYPDRPYRGRFDRLRPLVTRGSGVVKARVAILDPDDALLVEMNCRVLFSPGKSDSADADLPLLPEQARVREGDEWVAYVLDGQAARRRVIECGPAAGGSVPVRGGLRPGDRVLMAAGHSLYDGKVIRPRLP